jgi:MFS family permease
MDNRFRLLVASFLTLIAAGMGFAIRNGGILGEWGAQFGFTKTDLGEITGMGLTGFGITIIFFSLFTDKIGYKPVLVLAFLLHVLSSVLTYLAIPMYDPAKPETKETVKWLLSAGAFVFALANGTCEAVINPLVATLYSKQKTHYLNILHAGWPGGLILGGLLAFLFVGENAVATRLHWGVTMSFFLLPVLVYGLMTLMETFPKSETQAAGIPFADMLSVFKSPMLWCLLFLHACIGFVELGTDSWITDIMENVIVGKAVLLFVYTSALMFVLRFFAGPIVEKINPVGLLCISAILGCMGLVWLGSAAGMTVVVAATVYGIGKTFLWPTILGVVGERYPKGGALVMGLMGGIGMLSAGILGGPVIGYMQDYFASQKLESVSKETFDAYAKKETSSLYGITPEIRALDGEKVGEITKKNKEGKGGELTSEEKDVLNARLYGGQMALTYTALVPLTMAIGFGALAAYFASVGGYRQEVLHGAKPDGERYTGGVEGPVEA